MKASERTVQQLLHAGDQYVIPVFQRYYTWGRPNWEQLVEDIDELLEPGAEDRRHFMGSIVTVAHGHQPGAISAYQVIDGQQRLTTVSILLCAVRDVATEHGWHELAAEVDENYLVHRFRRERERYKLHPRMRDRGAYLALVDRAEGGGGGQIQAAHRHFSKHLEQFASTQEELRKYFTAIATRMDFVAITLGAESPYKIFRSLNSTGVDLSEADLIRNHVFMSLPIDEQDAFDDTLWRELESRFIRDGKVSSPHLGAFLRDALMRDGTYIGRDGTYEAFEHRFPNGRFDPRAVVGAFTKVSKLYDLVLGTIGSGAPEIDQALAAIRELNVTTSYPLLLALLERFDRNDLGRGDVVAVLRGISGFVLRRVVCGLGSRAYSAWFVAACRELAKSPNDLFAFLRAKGWPSDEEFQSKFVRFSLYHSKYDKPVLRSLERATQSKSEPVLLDGCTIEHVMPQTIDETDDDGRHWVAALGGEWKARHGEWLHTPGNLTLVGADYNIGMSNCSFDLKKPVLGASRVYLNEHFQQESLRAWSPTEIEARAKLLAERASKIWIGPPDGMP